jgi:hypothetical protein
MNLKYDLLVIEDLKGIMLYLCISSKKMIDRLRIFRMSPTQYINYRFLNNNNNSLFFLP